MYALRHATETTATVWCRHTANGALSLVVDGREFIGDTIDTAVGDGTGTVTATGLQAGRSYPFSLRVSGTEIHSGTLRTMPTAGTDFSALLTYCYSPYRPALPIDAAIEQEKKWAKFLFRDGSIIGLNEALLSDYVDWIADKRMRGKQRSKQ
jgi:hypothetical protein